MKDFHIASCNTYAAYFKAMLPYKNKERKKYFDEILDSVEKILENIKNWWLLCAHRLLTQLSDYLYFWSNVLIYLFEAAVTVRDTLSIGGLIFICHYFDVFSQ